MVAKLVKSIAHRLDLMRLRRNQMESVRLRKIFSERYGVHVGLYTFGCFDTWRVASETYVGRYCSIARTVIVIRGNHPYGYLTTHPYLYDPAFGVVDRQHVVHERLDIEDDAWIGHYAVVTPSCRRIGRGAVIAAGAVVTHDVPPYAIVAGVPAKVIRYRFEPDVIAAIEQSKWWEMSKDELKAFAESRPDAAFHPSVQALGRFAAQK